MDKRDQKTLRRIEQNDAALTELLMGSYFMDNEDGAFNSWESEDYSRLGAAIGNNTHLTKLVIAIVDNESAFTNSEFFDGLKQNTSIRELRLDCDNRIIAGGLFHEILKAYQENNNHLTFIRIRGVSLQNGGDDIIASTLRRCTNLKQISLYEINMTDAQLLPIVDAIRGGHHQLEELDLDTNNIGDACCAALATLLEDPNCNLQSLDLSWNQIGDGGATAIANSLSRNNKLQKLDLCGNSINRIGDIFCGVLCNTSSINSMYSSNHVLNDVEFRSIGPQLVSLLKMNMDTNKSNVAIKKILKYHSNIDMKPMFEWDAEDGEQNLKALPYVVDWFDRGKVAVAANAEGDDEGDGDNAKSDDEEESYNIDRKKLSAIFQFAIAMPTLFVPASHNEGGKKKQKLL